MQVEITENKTYVEILGPSESAVQVEEVSPQIVQVAGDVTTTVEIQEQPLTVVQVSQQSTVVEVLNQVVSIVEVGGTELVDHGELTGLGDDDHSQYLLANGSRQASEIRLTPKPSSSGPEGTIFYASADDHVYVATEL